MVWRHARRGLTARVFWGYLAVALVVAIASPGMAVFAADSAAPDEPGVTEPAVEPTPAEEPVTEEPAVEPAPPAAEPVVEPAPPAAAPTPAEEPAPVAEPVLGEPEIPESAPVAAPLAAAQEPATKVEPDRSPITEPVPAGWARLEPVTSGYHWVGGKYIWVNVADGASGPTFSFMSGPWPFGARVLGVRVKGGPEQENPNTYMYAAPGVYSDTDLHALVNPNNGKYYGLSHVDFLFGGGDQRYVGKIVVHKYNDNDPTNGAFDDEPMLGGWEFILRDATGADIAHATTGPDGTATFGDLAMGSYFVEEVLKPGWANTTGLTVPVTLTAPTVRKPADCVDIEIRADAWFGNVHEDYIGKIVVHKYNDNDPTNGAYDDEPMLAGWEFILYDAQMAELARATTGPDGTCEFTGLPLGDYFVREVLQAGWVNTTGLTVPVTLAAPSYSVKALEKVEGPQLPPPVEIVGHAWFGNVREVYTKYFELTYSHTPPELDGFRVSFLLNSEPEQLDLVLDGDVWKASIEVVYPYVISGVTWWGHAADGWIMLGYDEGREVLEGDLTNYFHYDPSLSGHKYNDLDGDGEWDEGEPAIEGWAIYLYRLPNPQLQEIPVPPAGAVLVDQTLTDANGYYEFVGMLPGLYWIAEEERAGWTPTDWPDDQPIWVDNGTHISDLDFGNMSPVTKTFEFTFVDPPEGLTYWVRYWIEGEAEPHWLELEGDNPFTGSVELKYGTTLTRIDWIVYQDSEEFVLGTTGPEMITEDMTNPFEYRSHIGGYKFDDEDGEGDWDEGEPPIGGWKITLYREVVTPPIEVGVGAAAAALIPVGETFTDGEGYWEFNGLLPGRYLVEEEDREGWEMTLGPEGTFVVENGTDRDDLIFGNTQFQPFSELDLAITKLADREWASPGAIVTYTLTYWNNGDVPAENFTIVDDYDETYMTPVNTAGGVVAGGKITWTLPGPLAKEDGSKTIVYTMRVDSDMPDGVTNLDNDVEIKHPRDTNPDNNYDDERVKVRVGEEPFLPFTGGEYLMLLGAAAAAAAAGFGLRVRSARKQV